MIPIYLKLLNFMSHEDTEIDFRKIDVACIQGPNGAGKSALADGMLYALYGQTSRGKDDDIVRLGCQEMTDIFDFEQSAQVYRIIRKKSILGRGKNIVELYTLNESDDSWTPLSTGDSAKGMILDILHRDYNTFISSSFLLQGQGERLITSKPSERYKVVFDIMGCERYTEYRKKTKSKGKRLPFWTASPTCRPRRPASLILRVYERREKQALEPYLRHFLRKKKSLSISPPNMRLLQLK